LVLHFNETQLIFHSQFTEEHHNIGLLQDKSYPVIVKTLSDDLKELEDESDGKFGLFFGVDVTRDSRGNTCVAKKPPVDTKSVA